MKICKSKGLEYPQFSLKIKIQVQRGFFLLEILGFEGQLHSQSN